MEQKSWPIDCAWPEPLMEELETKFPSAKKSSSKSSEKSSEAMPMWKSSEHDKHDDGIRGSDSSLREYKKDMLDVLHYYQYLVEEGLLDESYFLVSPDMNFDAIKELTFAPERAIEYWSSAAHSMHDDKGNEDKRNQVKQVKQVKRGRAKKQEAQGDQVGHFDIASWQRDFTTNLGSLVLPQPNPIEEIQSVIDYMFLNENLLRQAFTRKAFSLEHGIGNSQQLEFLGDAILNIVVTKELLADFTEVDDENVRFPFHSSAPSTSTNRTYDARTTAPKGKTRNRGTQNEGKGGTGKGGTESEEPEERRERRERRVTEGDLTKIRTKFINKEYLSSRASLLGLDNFILYGSSEEAGNSAREDALEALIGAVAIDSGWDWETLERVVKNLVNIQLLDPDSLLEETFFEKFNNWHQKRWGCMPTYRVDRLEHVDKDNNSFSCILHYFTVDYMDERRSNMCCSKGETRAEAREKAAKYAYGCVERAGLLEKNIKRDSGIKPDFEVAVNQIQELKQKKYIKETEYYYFTLPATTSASTASTASTAAVKPTSDKVDNVDKKSSGKDGKVEGTYICSCYCAQAFSGICGFGRDNKSKRKAKKLAAFDALNILFATSSEAALESSSEASSTVVTVNVGTAKESREDTGNTRNTRNTRNTGGSDLNIGKSSDSVEWLKLMVFPRGWTDDDVYRVLKVPTALDLDDLCGFILDSFDFDHDHLYTFTVKDEIYLSKDADLDKPWTTGIKLKELGLKVGDCLLLHYDFGDNWHFVISVLSDNAFIDFTDTDLTSMTVTASSKAQGRRSGRGNNKREVVLIAGKGKIEQYPDYE